MALNIALCDDILGLIGEQVETIRSDRLVQLLQEEEFAIEESWCEWHRRCYLRGDLPYPGVPGREPIRSQRLCLHEVLCYHLMGGWGPTCNSSDWLSRIMGSAQVVRGARAAGAPTVTLAAIASANVRRALLDREPSSSNPLRSRGAPQEALSHVRPDSHPRDHHLSATLNLAMRLQREEDRRGNSWNEWHRRNRCGVI
jgi:hypothetical protein